jgi:hypothetical protein
LLQAQSLKLGLAIDIEIHESESLRTDSHAAPVTQRPQPRHGEDPEHAGSVFVERDDAVARDLSCIAGVVDGESNPVEARDAVVGAEPEVAVARLDERGDGIDRQPVGDRPVFADVRSVGRCGLAA